MHKSQKCSIAEGNICGAGSMKAEYERVTSLIRYMQSVQGRQMWVYEEVSLRNAGLWVLPSSEAMGSLANAILDSIFFESGLRERWAQEALRWMLEASSRHFACRSHQVCLPIAASLHLPHVAF